MRRGVRIKQPQLRKARIEIIPMIDTIFFLLVFFMFTSLSMVKMRGMDVSLPKESSTDTKPPPQVIITINQAGAFYLNTAQIDPNALETNLQNRINANPQTVLIVNVDKTRPMQNIIDVMDAANHVSIPGHPNDPVSVMIATAPLNPDGTAESGTPNVSR